METAGAGPLQSMKLEVYLEEEEASELEEGEQAKLKEMLESDVF